MRLCGVRVGEDFAILPTLVWNRLCDAGDAEGEDAFPLIEVPKGRKDGVPPGKPRSTGTPFVFSRKARPCNLPHAYAVS